VSKILLTPRQRGHWTIIVHFVGAVLFNVVVGAFHSLSESIMHASEAWEALCSETVEKVGNIREVGTAGRLKLVAKTRVIRPFCYG
jgi:hypothetical protein